MFKLTEFQIEHCKRIIEYYIRVNDKQSIANDIMIRSKVRLKKISELILELDCDEISEDLKEFIINSITEETHKRNTRKCSLQSNMNQLMLENRSKQCKTTILR